MHSIKTLLTGQEYGWRTPWELCTTSCETLLFLHISQLPVWPLAWSATWHLLFLPCRALSKLPWSPSLITMQLGEGEELLKLFPGPTWLDMGMASAFRGNQARPGRLAPSRPPPVCFGSTAFWETTAWTLTTAQHSFLLKPLLSVHWRQSLLVSLAMFSCQISIHCKRQRSNSNDIKQTKAPSTRSRNSVKYSAVHHTEPELISPLSPYLPLFSPTPMGAAPRQSSICISKQHRQLVSDVFSKT